MKFQDPTSRGVSVTLISEVMVAMLVSFIGSPLSGIIFVSSFMEMHQLIHKLLRGKTLTVHGHDDMIP